MPKPPAEFNSSYDFQCFKEGIKISEHQHCVNNLSEFVKEIQALNNTLIQNGMDKNEILLFRGQASTEFELIPSLGRNRKCAADISILNEERNMIEMAKLKLPDVFHNDLQPLELLALLQHHGIPTRLLDITENALVALYFACCSNEQENGEVFVFKNNELSITNFPIINGIADSYRLVRGSFYPLNLFYDAMTSQPYFLEQNQMIKICHKEPEDKINWIVECCKEPFFVYAPIRSLRQQMQRGRYILFPNRILNRKPCFEAIIKPIQKDHPCICKQIIIPKQTKEQMLQELKLFGISRETLFADSVDIVCEEITNTFKRKVDIANCDN